MVDCTERYSKSDWDLRTSTFIILTLDTTIKFVRMIIDMYTKPSHKRLKFIRNYARTVY